MRTSSQSSTETGYFFLGQIVRNRTTGLKRWTYYSQIAFLESLHKFASSEFKMTGAATTKKPLPTS